MTRDDLNEVFEMQISFLRKSCKDFDNGDQSEGIRIAGHLRTLLHDSERKNNIDSSLTSKIDKLKERLKSKTFDDKTSILNDIDQIKQIVQNKQTNFISSKSLFNQMNLFDIYNFLDSSIPKNIPAYRTFDNGITNSTINKDEYYGLLAIHYFVDNNCINTKYSALCKYSNFVLNAQNTLNFETWWNKEIYTNHKKVSYTRKNLILDVANKDGYAHVDENIGDKYKEYKESNSFNNFVSIYSVGKTLNAPTLNSVRQIAFEFLYSIGQNE